MEQLQVEATVVVRVVILVEETVVMGVVVKVKEVTVASIIHERPSHEHNEYLQQMEV